jgi:CRP-like cAMP-binding protein
MFLRGIPDSCRCETCDGRFRCALLDLPHGQRTELDSIRRQCFSVEGTVLFLQGEPADGVFLIRQGWVKLFRSSAAGDVTSTALVGSGYLLGLPEVFSDQPRPLGAEAVSGCDFDFVPAEPFRQFTRRHADVALRLLKAVCGVLHQLSLDLAGHQPSVAKLMTTLQKLAADCGRPRDRGVRLTLAFTVGDLADQIGCSRQWTSKLLADLEGEGMIERRKGWITLTDRGLAFASPAASGGASTA